MEELVPNSYDTFGMFRENCLLYLEQHSFNKRGQPQIVTKHELAHAFGYIGEYGVNTRKLVALTRKVLPQGRYIYTVFGKEGYYCGEDKLVGDSFIFPAKDQFPEHELTTYMHTARVVDLHLSRKENPKDRVKALQFPFTGVKEKFF